MKKLFLFLLASSLARVVSGQPASPSSSPIIFIYDASGSMWGQMEGKTKMDIARSVLTDVVNTLPEDQAIGLVAYGHRRKSDCEDVEFLVETAQNTKKQIAQSLLEIKPLGSTPLAHSLSLVIEMLGKTQTKATIILITDGIESCKGNLCDVVKSARKTGIDFRMHVVGFGLQDSDTEALKCAAQAAEGQYYDASDSNALSDVLQNATSNTIEKPVGNFTLYTTRNGQPVDAICKVSRPGEDKAINSVRTYGDTAKMFLPEGAYDLIVAVVNNSKVSPQTLRKVWVKKDSINHRTVSFDAGKLLLNTYNNAEPCDALVTLYDQSGKSVAASRTYGRTDHIEVDPGVYNVQIKAVKIDGTNKEVRISDVKIEAEKPTVLDYQFQSGTLMIGARHGNELVDAAVTIRDASSHTTVASGRTYTSPTSNPKEFTLTPGTYEVAIKGLKDFAGKTEAITVQVKTGEKLERIANF